MYHALIATGSTCIGTCAVHEDWSYESFTLFFTDLGYCQVYYCFCMLGGAFYTELPFVVYHLYLSLGGAFYRSLPVLVMHGPLILLGVPLVRMSPSSKEPCFGPLASARDGCPGLTAS